LLRTCCGLVIYVAAKIHYTSFPVTSPQQIRNVNDKSETSWRGRGFLPTPTCYGLVYVADLLWTGYGETGVMDFGLWPVSPKQYFQTWRSGVSL